ncbi:MAG: helix-turn-helix domain-containing protein [Solirubrobacteraceae bacterium]
MAGGDARSLAQDAQQALRVRAVKLVVEQDWSQVQAAEAVGVGERQMRRWMVRYRRGGWKALEKRESGGVLRPERRSAGKNASCVVEG